MIISPGRRYIFVHIPKTGGTSMALALESRAMKDDIMLGDTPKARRRRRRLQGVNARGRLWKHSTLADIEGVIPRAEIGGYFTFALVRNPWDRVVSYYHWLRVQRFDHPAVHLARTVDFAGFLRDPATQSSLRANPARRYVTTSDGVEVPTCFLRLEHLEDDAAPLWSHLGFRLEIPHVNRSERHRGYRGAYDTALAGIVAQCCGEDIARFGYLF